MLLLTYNYIGYNRYNIYNKTFIYNNIKIIIGVKVKEISVEVFRLFPNIRSIDEKGFKKGKKSNKQLCNKRLKELIFLIIPYIEGVDIIEIEVIKIGNKQILVIRKKDRRAER